MSRYIPFADGNGGITLFDTVLPDVDIQPQRVADMTVRDLERAKAAATTHEEAERLEDRHEAARRKYPKATVPRGTAKL